LGYISCSQLEKPQKVNFYLDSGCTVTTLLDIDVVRLGLYWRNLKQTTCETAIGEAYPFILPEVTVLLKSFEDGKVWLNPISLKLIHLLPPEDPTTILPVQYEFAFSLLGMDVMQKFVTWKMDYKNKKVINIKGGITMKFIYKESDINELENLINEYIDSLSSPIDSFLEDHILDSVFYKIENENEIIGYFSIYKEILLTQFYIINNKFKYSQEIFKEVRDKFLVEMFY